MFWDRVLMEASRLLPSFATARSSVFFSRSQADSEKTTTHRWGTSPTVVHTSQYWIPGSASSSATNPSRGISSRSVRTSPTVSGTRVTQSILSDRPRIPAFV